MGVTPDAWDSTWDRVFAARPWGRYPSEELVACVSRLFGAAADRSAVRVLEVGCGTGANLWFLAREGYAASGIEGSAVAVGQARDRLAADGLVADVLRGDLLALPYPDGTFDLVVDIAAIQHNTLANRASIVAEVRRVLKPGGRLFSLLIAAGSWGDATGPALEPGTFAAVSQGPGAGCGLIHFSREDELLPLFAEFTSVDYERRDQTRQGRTRHVAFWIVTAVR